MWMPPWMHGVPVALGAGPASASDREIATKTAAVVKANIDAGRPFYANVPPEFDARFRQMARGMYFWLRGHPRLMIKGIDQAEKDQEALRIVNKAYYNALRGISGYKGDSSLSTWFYAIARRAMIDDLRMYLRSPMGKNAPALYGEGPEGAEAAATVKEALDRYGAEESDENFTILGAVSRFMDTKDAEGKSLVDPADMRIFRAVAAAKGNMDQAARALGLSRMGLESQFLAAGKRAEENIKRYFASGRAGKDSRESEDARRRRALQERLARQRGES